MQSLSQTRGGPQGGPQVRPASLPIDKQGKDTGKCESTHTQPILFEPLHNHSSRRAVTSPVAVSRPKVTPNDIQTVSTWLQIPALG